MNHLPNIPCRKPQKVVYIVKFYWYSTQNKIIERLFTLLLNRNPSIIKEAC